MKSSNALEAASCFLTTWIDKRLSSFGFIDVSYGRLDLEKNFWLEIPMRLDWLRHSLSMGLDNHLLERTEQGTHHWQDLSAPHQDFIDFIEQDFGDELKRLTIATIDNHQRNYITVTYRGVLSLQNYAMFYQILSALSFEVNKLIKEYKEKLYLPFPERLEIVPETLVLPQINEIDDHRKYFFKGVTLTALDLKYIEFLLSFKSYKEIAFERGCSDTAVRKKMTTIKAKFGDPSMSNSRLFSQLKRHGGTVVCAYHLMNDI